MLHIGYMCADCYIPAHTQPEGSLGNSSLLLFFCFCSPSSFRGALTRSDKSRRKTVVGLYLINCRGTVSHFTPRSGPSGYGQARRRNYTTSVYISRNKSGKVGLFFSLSFCFVLQKKEISIFKKRETSHWRRPTRNKKQMSE